MIQKFSAIANIVTAGNFTWKQYSLSRGFKAPESSMQVVVYLIDYSQACVPWLIPSNGITVAEQGAVVLIFFFSVERFNRRCFL